MSKQKNFLTLLWATEPADLSEDLNTSLELALFLIKYAFLTDSDITLETILKRQFHSHGEIFFQNLNGARYLDPKYSRWISTDPALGEYVPQAPVSDEAKKYNQNLPGMGGLFNTVNFSLYHYAGNNPVRYLDPDGNVIIMFGVTGNAGCGTGVAENFGVFICTDGKNYLSLGHYSTSSVGGVAGITVSGGFEITIAPNADEFSDIEGFSILAGGSGGLGGLVSIGAEVGYNPTAKTSLEKFQSLTVSVSATVGLPTGCPGEGHTYKNFTKKVDEFIIADRNIINKIYDDLCCYLLLHDYEGARDYVNNLSEAFHD